MSDDTEVSKPQETVEAKEPKTRTPPKQPKKITVRPVYGRMVHMLTAQEIVGDTEVPEIDGWLQAQIDAGKIVVVVA
jgi:hypothetical protein